MNVFLGLPLEARMIVIFVFGACVGSAVNLAIYGLAWNPRPISPWSQADSACPPRRLSDRLPIFGWLGLRREADFHGTCFWLRPMAIELLTALGLAWLYWWEVSAAGLLPPGVQWALPHDWPQIAQCQFLAHAALIALMLAASMIDVDERTIPDAITVTGALFGLLTAAAWPWRFLPDVLPMAGGGIRLDIVHLSWPNVWPAWLDGFPRWGSLAVAGACWLSWCIALLPRSWHGRRGPRIALQLCCARIARHPMSYRILCMAVIGSLAIGLAWYRGGEGWRGLLTALVGMAAGGGLVWSVRIVGGVALHREAMGFGDVTLMAMIGAFLGWQPCLIIFVLAPFAGLAVSLLRLLLFRDREIPYGPFLCLATLFLIVYWHALWERTQDVFSMGWLVPLLVVCCLGLMGLMLAAWHLIANLFMK
jgi:leader peptidase (prepilin peptidase) / N-methyltransferase